MLRNRNRFMAASVLAGLVVLGFSIHNLTAQDRAAGGGKKGKAAAAQPAGEGGATGGQAGSLATHDISLEQAHAILEAAARKSSEIGTKMDIAIVDAGGNLKAFARQDGAWLGSIDISIKKAKTARYFDMPTGEIGKLSQPGGPLYNIEHSNNGLITFPGGLPLKDADGQIIGAIGVSGSTVEDDHTVAQAGAEAALKAPAGGDHGHGQEEGGKN
jgi:uncharacterized protein GlcG (DUF336 family)